METLKKDGFDVGIVKFCSKCKRFLYHAYFQNDKSQKCKFSAHCKLCKQSSERIKHAKYKIKKKAVLDAAKGDSRCAECKRESKHLQFAHFTRDDAPRHPGGVRAPTSSLSIKALANELKKGRYLCYECHYKETNTENVEMHPSNAKKPAMVQQCLDFRTAEALAKKHCADCKKDVDESNVQFFLWKFRDAQSKVQDIARMVWHGLIDELRVEIKKCDLLCYDCHRDRTETQWQQGTLKNIHVSQTARKIAEATAALPPLPEFKSSVS